MLCMQVKTVDGYQFLTLSVSIGLCLDFAVWSTDGLVKWKFGRIGTLCLK